MVLDLGLGTPPLAAVDGIGGAMMADDPLAAQVLAYARDMAKLAALRRAYERLLPAGLDPLDPAPPAPAMRPAVTLFTDLRGFTHLSERFADNPAFVLEVVNSHLEVVVRAIHACGGVVEKFVGDGVFATFGARGPLDHADRCALAAGIGIVGANEGLNRRAAARWGFRLNVGVGIAQGLVVLGMVGAAQRAELGVLGDPVNVAARLVAQAGGGEVLLTGDVFRLLGDAVRGEVLGAQAVRGRLGAIDLYRIRLTPPAVAVPRAAA